MEKQGESRTLGEALRQRRLELGWTQETLAARVADLGGDLRQSDVSRLERGKVGLPRRDRLERIAAALGLSLGGLLARSGWAGADGAFDGAPETAPPRPRPEPAPTVPPAPPTPVPPPPAALTPRLRSAIDRARDLEAWSTDVLRRTATTFELANERLGPGAVLAPSNAGDDEHRATRAR